MKTRSALGIDRERRPRVRGAGPMRLLAVDLAEIRIGRVRRHFRGARNRIPMPELATAAHIERAHDADLDIGAAVVADRRAHDGDIARDRRRRGHLIVAELAFDEPHAFRQRDLAVRAEIGAAFAGLRIDREKARIDRREHDALRARRVRGAHGRRARS